jgi:hypothetical protein
MLGMEKSRMTWVMDPGGRPLRSGEAWHPPSNLRGAKKRLMETHPSSGFDLTNCNYEHLPFSNRNSTRCFSRSRLPLQDSNRQLETIRNGRNPFTINQMTFSNRPKKTGVERAPKIPKAKRRQDAGGTLGEGKTPAGSQRYEWQGQRADKTNSSSLAGNRFGSDFRIPVEFIGLPKPEMTPARRRRRNRWPSSRHAIFASRTISNPDTPTGGRRC